MATLQERLRKATERGALDVDLRERLKRITSGTEPLTPSPPSPFERMGARIMGTDVDDPLALARASSTATLAIGGAKAGLRTPVAPGPLGLAINPVTGALVGGAAGAFAGAVAPEMSAEFLEFIGAVPEGTRDRKGLNDDELLALAEAEVLIDLTIGGAAQGLKLAARAGSRFLAGVTPEGSEIATRAAAQGIELPAVAAGTSRFAKFFTTVFGRFLLIGDPLRTAGRRAGQQIKDIANELPERIAPVFAESDLGQQIFRGARLLSKTVSKKFDEQYTKLFADADEGGVLVTPKATMTKADEIIAKIESEIPTTAKEALGVTFEKGSAGEVMDKIRTFIKDDILSLRELTEGGTVIAKQRLIQMDGLMAKINQKLASLEPGQAKFVSGQLKQLKLAIQKDMLNNMTGEGAEEITKRFAVIDEAFSKTIRQLFETSAAKRFTSVRRRGIRGMTSDEATRTPIDKLFKIVVDTNSPQIVTELSRITTKTTFRRITARVLDDAFDVGFKSTKNEQGFNVFDADKVIRKLGLNRKASAKVLALDAMLKKSSGLALKDLNAILEGARQLGDFAIPGLDAFIARRASLGGFKAIMGGLLPGIAVAGAGGVAGGGAGIVGGLFGLVLFVGGGRTVANMLADPLAARFLRTVASKTATIANKRASAIRAFRFAVEAANESGEIPDDLVGTITEMGRQTIVDLSNNFKTTPERAQRFLGVRGDIR